MRLLKMVGYSSFVCEGRLSVTDTVSSEINAIVQEWSDWSAAEI